jgi:hypothetical protein
MRQRNHGGVPATIEAKMALPQYSLTFYFLSRVKKGKSGLMPLYYCDYLSIRTETLSKLACMSITGYCISLLYWRHVSYDLQEVLSEHYLNRAKQHYDKHSLPLRHT